MENGQGGMAGWIMDRMVCTLEIGRGGIELDIGTLDRNRQVCTRHGGINTGRGNTDTGQGCRYGQWAGRNLTLDMVGWTLDTGGWKVHMISGKSDTE